MSSRLGRHVGAVAHPLLPSGREVDHIAGASAASALAQRSLASLVAFFLFGFGEDARDGAVVSVRLTAATTLRSAKHGRSAVRVPVALPLVGARAAA